jgi:L-lactate dehydrogenase complex protein LldF
MNVCPVYRTVGGHSYGATYPGPMGIVLTTLLTGMAASHPLIDASTLCGACNEVCPVKIPLTKLIVNQRQRRVAEGFSPAVMSIGMRLFGIAARSPFLFSSGERLAEIFWPIMRKLGGKDVTGRVPRPSSKSFRRRVK